MATFSASDCVPCPARALCTTGKRRQLSLLPRDLAQAQAAARAAETTIGFQADYARRAGVEGTMHQAASHGARRVLPGLERVAGQPPANRGRRDGELAAGGQFAGQVRAAPPR